MRIYEVPLIFGMVGWISLINRAKNLSKCWPRQSFHMLAWSSYFYLVHLFIKRDLFIPELLFYLSLLNIQPQFFHISEDPLILGPCLIHELRQPFAIFVLDIGLQ